MYVYQGGRTAGRYDRTRDAPHLMYDLFYVFEARRAACGVWYKYGVWPTVWHIVAYDILWYMVYGTRGMVYGMRCMVQCIWYLVNGAWSHMVYSS